MPNRDLLARCGIALYGREWVSPLARDLGIKLRKMQRWAAGHSDPHPDAWEGIRSELRPMLEARRRILADDREAIASLLKML